MDKLQEQKSDRERIEELEREVVALKEQVADLEQRVRSAGGQLQKKSAGTLKK